jgi:hypothetical protein
MNEESAATTATGRSPSVPRRLHLLGFKRYGRNSMQQHGGAENAEQANFDSKKCG